MNNKELIVSILKRLGYQPEIDEDGDIMVRYQMKCIYFFASDDDESYVTIKLLQFHEIEEGKEMTNLVVCNKLTRELRIAKVFIDQTFKYISASCDFVYANEEALEMNIKASLDILGVVRSLFKNELAELIKDD